MPEPKYTTKYYIYNRYTDQFYSGFDRHHRWTSVYEAAKQFDTQEQALDVMLGSLRAHLSLMITCKRFVSYRQEV